MRRRIILSLFFFLFIYFNLKSQDSKAYLSPNIEFLWKSAPILSTPESVYYCKNHNVLFVSNINGNPLVKDNNGFISTLTPEGNILELKWVTGLNAPKGMAVHNDRLYVADINRIAEIDIVSKAIVKFYVIKGAIFLNDIEIDKNGDIYVSDMNAKSIYKISGSKIERWIISKKISNPNGLSISNGFLFVGTSDRILKIQIKDKSISDYLLNTGNIDGLIYFGIDHIIYSDWEGRIYFTGLGKESMKVIDTSALKINAADIGFIKEKGIILVPTFFDNRIMAYRLKMLQNGEQ
ncbi:MAG: hypothetical protein A2041_01480 [Bacteroidetes bacterium GWA2_31_9b]|nr:MAG: hypothetical protein A2041_01480 [Bacteroidetes bacterium GWA2_31_9b]